MLASNSGLKGAVVHVVNFFSLLTAALILLLLGGQEAEDSPDYKPLITTHFETVSALMNAGRLLHYLQPI